ncbi:hypothetical protein HMPREF1210_00553 [Paenisporosarcina sp. HGH0030]|uniref:DUF1259 domain-containing protein n=1 Tax=Paenisporosarcina sp. HGH0030 TaxID=1078085 RepID=UPI00034E5B91|nr:DUF1259 domain-containing protein [Paenisporosarcina sp. HGH0030]EPD53730.1 hypothetical protein HMPREF1210_00553 [Paenisporosarcina sp. HGH0030]
METFNTLCQQFGQILNGKPDIENGICSVEINRDIPVTIQGRPVRGNIETEIMFEDLDQYGYALNRGVTVILEKEVPYFVNTLVKNGIIISALHNNWLYTKPNILYINFQSVEPPLTFAHKVAEALRTLRGSR